MNENFPQYFIVDVFGKQKYGGGPLAVFINCQSLNSTEMQGIAHELNFPETTFVTRHEPEHGGFNVRIFTPKSEIDFAGHPTLGTAYIIQKHLLKNFQKTVTLNLKVGQVPVVFEDDVLWMEQIQPEFRELMDLNLMAQTLGLEVSDFDENFPAQGVSTGLPFTVVPLRNIEALEKAEVNLAIYNEHFLKKASSKGILIFCLSENLSEALLTRVFVNYLGIPEDPATGSASGCLAGFLVKYNYLDSSDIDIKIGQGQQMGRPSVISIRASIADNNYKIFVGGGVTENANGKWII